MHIADNCFGAQKSIKMRTSKFYAWAKVVRIFISLNPLHDYVKGENLLPKNLFVKGDHLSVSLKLKMFQQFFGKTSLLG